MASSSKHYADLLYRRKRHEVGSREESPEFIIRIYPEDFEAWKKNPTEIPLTQVVDSWEVYVAHSGAHSGVLDRPSHDLLHEVFGSIKFEDIFAFMAEHGHVKESTRGGDLEGDEKGAYLKK